MTAGRTDHTTGQDAIAEEQAALDAARARRLEIQSELAGRLSGSAEEDSVAAAAMRSTRARLYELAQAEQGLVFGRLDSSAGDVLRIGRVGVTAADDDADPLVVDWRADASRPFYTATAVATQGQSRRRHIRTEGPSVVGVDDELLDGSTDGDLVGEGSLLAALDERRTGRMGTAVATLQREQDDIVRAGARGALVVQGGPGTGKTVVALHRVAYLLFAHPQLARAGVLVLGPSQRFLDYIGQVLPALGETAVVAATCESLVPGVRPERRESRALAEIKGRALWQRALADHVAGLVPPPADLTLHWDGEDHVVPAATIERLQRGALSGRSYHHARRVLTAQLVDVLTDLVADRAVELLASAEEGFEEILDRVDKSLAREDDRGARTQGSSGSVDGELSEDEVEELRQRIEADPGIATRLAFRWPDRDPADELRRLLSDRDALTAVPGLTDVERDLVAAEPAPFAPSDIALLDALADLLGEAAQRERQGDFIADRAAAQRDWVYGHVVVDEAQELSAMEWQMVARRCPAYSVTAVGDIDQTEAPHAHTTWEGAVGEVLTDRWRRADLTICYRTPREVMELTGPVLEAAGSTNTPPRAVRSSGVEPWLRTVVEADLAATVATEHTALVERWEGGSVGVVAPASRVAGLRDALGDAIVMTATQAKGLEWDATLVVDPDGIAAEPRGWNALYVALTRCTQELGRVEIA
ncbi:AAA family ATPase [Janibacter hoylei]|uniref:HelD family protein n=1 Tax=Janibacter hoylei TaxID=364298 RepID=UPI002237C2AB|nr:AAA family ATPase [Janibacter hoylei]MCW4601729.1 AAA family ATPase [Janibacter hoylei]